MDKFIVPNFHALLIHFPIAMLGLGVVIELFSFLWRRSTFRVAGRWLILLGTLSAVPAVTSGLYALRDVVGHGSEADSWVQYKAGSNFGPNEWRFVRYHIWLNAGATALALIAVVMWIGASDLWRRILRIPALLMLVVAVGLMVDGGFHGGEMVYRMGFGVQGRQSVIPEPAVKPQSMEEKVAFYAPEGELHLFMAGLVFAIAAVALGLSIRRSVATDMVVIRRVSSKFMPPPAEQGNRPISLLQALNDPEDEIPVEPHVPVSRFWVLTMLVVIGTIGTGYWFGDFFRPWPKIIDRSQIQAALENIKVMHHQRMGLHIVFGGSILVLTIVLALLTRFVPRSRVFLSLFSLLLVLVMAAQVWVGILMTFDGDRGSLMRFKTEAEANAPDQENVMPGNMAPSTQPTTMPATTQPMAMAR